MTKSIQIDDLKFDDKNFNQHTEVGMEKLKESLKNYGAGRSILIDKDNNIIAGNGLVESAGKLGIKNVRVVETTGDEIIAVKRTDIELDSEKGREMALADNATSTLNLKWDFITLDNVFDSSKLTEWGIGAQDFSDEELDSFFSKKDDVDPEKNTKTIVCPNCGEEIEL